MEGAVPVRLVGSEIHGFHTMADLDIGNVTEEAKSRWLRPNEIHAILCNHKHFTIYVRPVNLPPAGMMVLFDRKMLRNFRKDGHNWKKKKDGKTVKEAHEHLKVGNDERIHVYYAHGEDNPTFVRRCYWLLDKKLEHIVLVHYRDTQESQGSPAAPICSNSCSILSEPSASRILPEESNSVIDEVYYTNEKSYLEPSENIQDHVIRLHEINTLDWDELVVPADPNKLNAPETGIIPGFEQPNSYGVNFYGNDSNSLSANIYSEANSSLEKFSDLVVGSNLDHSNMSSNVYSGIVDVQIDSNLQRNGHKQLTAVSGDSLDTINRNALQTQDSFGRWMTYVITDSPDSVLTGDQNLESSLSNGQETSTLGDQQQSSFSEQIFSITDVSPASALTTEETKILVVGYFHEANSPFEKSNLFCVCGDECFPAELIQPGVYRSFVSPQNPGVFDLYLSLDGQKSISQVVNFEYKSPTTEKLVNLPSDDCKWTEFRNQMRLAHLLFSTSRRSNTLTMKLSPNALKEAKLFTQKTSQITRNWNRLQEWLLERVVERCKVTDYDELGQGVIHLCAILGYKWAVPQFTLSGLSLDYRDKFGWTALHWAAYCGREEMVAILLSAGAKPNLVTDPTSENPGGCTAADLASKNGYDGLGAYLAEKGLVQHFEDMTLAGNVSGALQITTTNPTSPGIFTEEELYLKDTLAAYRTAADAAARIQAAFREQSLKVQADAAKISNPEDEARHIVAAMKIQHAYRKHDTRKKMVAAVKIQHRFHAWKMRKDFLNLRRQTIKIQAVYRGYQVRKEYKKIVFAVGVLEKAILRWRLKRKGFRGLQVSPDEAAKDPKQEDVVEDFFKASRKQAEERVERSVVRVQSMFRSKRAQEDYRRMKLAHNKAKLEYEGFLYPDTDMG
ncbi:Calmodulin-binding transcription activator 5 [Heracleum sosnowskyi]|uniref:Calmodulin-binding transcription activator 5 n=1 Tax=Heracleum sosnowskyi TaxID=360622 RepID=A0AAD8LWG8_9APIA|nr:Calmodulin-binding transcription activator 5 [Heracleum sosnowskyi]KAK1352502.1 Calmodulin-binding transcription activator 5 [Heracleum sosnowskyi]